MDGDELDAMLASLAAEDAATDAAFTVSVEQEAAIWRHTRLSILIRVFFQGCLGKMYV